MVNELKQKIISNVKIEPIQPPPNLGGQSYGIPKYSKMKIYSEELDLTIEFGYYRSALKNRDIVATLFELALDEIII